MQKRAIVDRYVEAMRNSDWDTVEDLVHPDITVRYPQSGEVIRGRTAYLDMLRNYPGGPPKVEIEKTFGTDESVQVSSPMPFGLPTVTVTGSTDTFTSQTIIQYEDGPWHGVLILRLREGKVFEDTSYFATPFDPPEWRAKYCEARG